MSEGYDETVMPQAPVEGTGSEREDGVEDEGDEETTKTGAPEQGMEQ